MTDSEDRSGMVARAMAAGVAHPAIQLTQTRFRLSVVDAWGISPGAAVLEVGCGQGDMTAALADAVGPGGRVVGVDPAPASYGSPVTLGESAEFLRNSALGQRVDVRFDFDVLKDGFPADSFDDVVLSHCGWYFASVDQLRSTLERVRPWARRLRFAEWDPRPTSLEQLPHLLAVLIQGQIEAAGARGGGNIRTPFSREMLQRHLEAAGWQVTCEQTVDTAAMQDADWEVAAALSIVDQRRGQLPVPVRDLVDSLADQLRAIASPAGNLALCSYALTAERTGA
jgi:ubiquinone/menaquinone biosynthesis C-methylase UbiE